RVQARRKTIAAGHDRAQVEIVLDAIQPQPVEDHRLELGRSHPDVDLEGSRRLIEPLDVLVEPEDGARIDPHALEYAIGEVEPAVEDRDRRLFAGHDLAVDVDLQARVCLHPTSTPPKFTSTLPRSSALHEAEGPITIVDSRSSMRAGPRVLSPAASW